MSQVSSLRSQFSGIWKFVEDLKKRNCQKSENLSEIWNFFKSLKICRKLSSKISRVTCLSECSMIVFFNNGCQLLTQSVTYLLSDKGTYWVVWGQLKISISDIFQVSVISIYQSMPGARGRPKSPWWSQTWSVSSPMEALLPLTNDHRSSVLGEKLDQILFLRENALMANFDLGWL